MCMLVLVPTPSPGHRTLVALAAGAPRGRRERYVGPRVGTGRDAEAVPVHRRPGFLGRGAGAPGEHVLAERVRRIRLQRAQRVPDWSPAPCRGSPPASRASCSLRPGRSAAGRRVPRRDRDEIGACGLDGALPDLAGQVGDAVAAASQLLDQRQGRVHVSVRGNDGEGQVAGHASSSDAIDEMRTIRIHSVFPRYG